MTIWSDPKPFPGQDPYVVPFEGSLLLIQSTLADSRISILKFPDLAHMRDFEEFHIWAPGHKSDHGRQIWAPELHRIGWRWYVYYAASDGDNRHHRTYVLEADHPLGPYHEVGQIRDAAHDTWAIDLTVLRHNRRLYAVWSGWEGVDDGFPQNLYIAPMSNPWTISGERTMISTPEHDWELSVAPINEGPQVLRNPALDKLFIVYSADASWTSAYKMGLLEWLGGDPLDASSWRKVSHPIFTGGGHGCFVDIGDTLYAIYHRKLTPEPGWSDRVIRYDPVTWDTHGYPVIGHRGAEEAPVTTMGPQMSAKSNIIPPDRKAGAGEETS
ncbi:MAG: glycoside hydrolase family 43 protein [Acidimicrobiia bacterium]|nr:glycoside hydrolase family 43 protein [Acidimicrobiia bacterium]